MDEKKMKQILQIADEIIPQRLKQNSEKIHQNMQKDPMFYVKGMLDVLKDIFDKTQEQQELGKKGKIAYISFSVLYNQILKGKYGFRIDVWTDEFYLDEYEIYAYWEPKEFFQYIDEDMNYLQKMLSSSYIPLKEYEMLELRNSYVVNYYDILIRLLTKMVPIIKKMKCYNNMERTTEVNVLIGEYMDQYQCVCKLSDEVK